MGSLSLKKRMDALDAFKEDENVPVFLLNKQCGAVGLNLTIATHIMILECVVTAPHSWFSPAQLVLIDTSSFIFNTDVLLCRSSWNPVWEEQAISRAHRMGQKGPIKVIRYLAEGACAHSSQACRDTAVVHHSWILSHSTKLLCADTVDSCLHDMMKATAARDDNIKTQLQDAVEMKGAFEADETALNKTICTCFKPAALAAMIGDLHDSSDEEDSESNADE